MPGWHAATESLSDRIGTFGVIQEQHPQRAELFLQWQQIDWPILVDAYDRLEVEVVPVTLLLDAEGIVREVVRSREDPAAIVERFLGSSEAVATEPPAERFIDVGRPEGVEPPQDAWDWFRAGVHHRKRYDEGAGAEAFAAAVDAWSRALELDPNNYIARRRLQQFGPRLDKPYPFYDWVDEARAEILARGETPVALPVEPRGAELATPIESFLVAEPDEEPDPLDRVRHDEGYIALDTVAVPPAAAPGESVRVHVELLPRAERDAHWNNEVEGLRLWFAAVGAEIDRRSVELPLPAEAVSEEPRRAELELRLTAERATLTGYALYYVCEGLRGQCLYRRQDFSIEIPSAS